MYVVNKAKVYVVKLLHMHVYLLTLAFMCKIFDLYIFIKNSNFTNVASLIYVLKCYAFVVTVILFFESIKWKGLYNSFYRTLIISYFITFISCFDNAF